MHPYTVSVIVFQPNSPCRFIVKIRHLFMKQLKMAEKTSVLSSVLVESECCVLAMQGAYVRVFKKDRPGSGEPT